MGSVSEWLARLAPAAIVLKAIVASALGITALMIFIMLRRWLRARYFARRERITFAIRKRWNELLRGTAPLSPWRFDPLGREVLETMLLDRIEVSGAEELPRLLEVVRRSGLMDRRIEEARTAEGWQRWRALVALGRTRAPEAAPALTDALDSGDMETRIAAVRGMGKLARAEGAGPILERLADGRLLVPWPVLRNALLSCCARHPEILLRYLESAKGQQRELLARVLAEIADASMTDELMVLASDPSAEVRAAAARALARAEAHVAVLALAMLTQDEKWFVRLRAVVALGSFRGEDVTTVLVRALGDRHRQVRQRAAWALMKTPESVQRVLRQVADTGDNYALQAVVAELERSGRFAPVLEEVRGTPGAEGERLASALQQAHARLALEAKEKAEKREEVGVA